MTTHALSPETPADTAEIRDLLLAAFETSHEADLVDALQLINLTPDYPPVSGEVTWPAEYGLDQGDDL
ncbi:hypothetical protein QM007_08510 [Rothia sp. SD9660Na]|uniref:hypothetical protein n=1 Tax=Rothia sp. SD9660Na TaxID=3047030 RepID=UPI0024B9BEEE|nr:hypothetical protein [Rothia sp. SD9660Na]WHS49951.1 hypothetical protein QM007_08510 [Rothia sp. SD9660Na]